MFAKNTQVGTDTVGVNSAPINSTQTLNIDNSSELKGVTTTDDIPSATQHETDTAGVNGITKTPTQSNSEQNEPETLPDLVLNENSAVNEANTTEDEDEAAEALLQLSKSDILPEEDTELPLGVLPVDAAPVLITLGNQDVLTRLKISNKIMVKQAQIPTITTTQKPQRMRNRTRTKRKTRIKIIRTIQNPNPLLNCHHRLPLPKVTW